MSTVLISGADADAVSSRLSTDGHAVTAATTVMALKELAPSITQGSVDLYIQLPVRVVTEGANAVDVIGHFLREGLLRRFDAASAVLPLLATCAATMLVGGNHPADSHAPDNPEARISLMKVLGHALLLEKPGDVTVSIVAGAGVERIAELAQQLLTSPSSAKPMSVSLETAEELTDSIPPLDYAHWRDALLTMTETRA
ncbi:MAG: hypothetical protein ACR2HR_07955 [Euzebya sp.]